MNGQMVENEMGLSASWLSDLVKDDAHWNIFISSKKAVCLGQCVVIKPVAKNIQAYAINCPLDIAEGLSKGLVAIVPDKANTANPFFDEVVDVLCGQGLLDVPATK